MNALSAKTGKFSRLFDSTALLAEIASLQTRLVEVIANRDAEQDPILRRRYYAAMVRLRNQIKRLTDRARVVGCI